MARHWSTRAPTNRFCKAHEFYTYINDTLQKPDTRYRSGASAERLGIYRRVFFWIPRPGLVDCVPRGQMKSYTPITGSNSIHRFVYFRNVAKLMVATSQRSCPATCEACTRRNWSSCKYQHHTGPVHELELKEVPGSTAAHQWTEKLAKQLGEHLVVGAYVAFVDRDCSRGYSIGKVLQLAPADGGIFQNPAQANFAAQDTGAKQAKLQEYVTTAGLCVKVQRLRPQLHANSERSWVQAPTGSGTSWTAPMRLVIGWTRRWCPPAGC
jgi:hypothetical protein